MDDQPLELGDLRRRIEDAETEDELRRLRAAVERHERRLRREAGSWALVERVKRLRRALEERVRRVEDRSEDPG